MGRRGPSRRRMTRRGTLPTAAALVLGAALGACGAKPTTVTEADAHFRATFPANPTRQAKTDGTARAQVTVISYSATAGGETDVVGFSTLPATAPSGPQPTRALDNAITGAASGVGGSVSGRRLLTYRGRPAEQAVIHSRHATLHERVVAFGSDLYVIEGITKSPTAPVPGYQRLLATFQRVPPA
ncbi:MAG: hypothetical protein ACYC1D_05475 [Acidimicrobiales bacterium]